MVTQFTWPMDAKFMALEDSDNIIVAADDEVHDYDNMIQYLADIYKQDTGRTPHFLNFTSREEANEFLFNNHNAVKVLFGVAFNSKSPYYDVTALYNESDIFTYNLSAAAVAYRLVWKDVMGKDTDFKFTVKWMLGKLIDVAYAQIGPAIAVAGLISIIPLFVTQPITDIRGEVRQYMQSCCLTLLPYWLATFLVDIVIWIITVLAVWGLFIILKIPAFMENKLNIIYLLVTIGPAFVVFSYCLSFTCASPESASRQLFVILCIIMIIPMIVDVGRMNFVDPVWLDVIWGTLPHVLLQRALAQMYLRINFMKQDLKYYWTENENVRTFFIMSLIDFPMYSFILWLIETLRVKMSKKGARKTYHEYTDFFADEKAKHPVTKEARELEVLVKSGVPFAVKVDNVSKLYFNTEGIPISAVNGVTLGVRDGQMFGFLGANGAGKTTLIKMITSMTPPSNGTIEILGKDITKHHDPTSIAICPQFNTHLCFEMTPREHFRLFRLLHNYSARQAEEVGNSLLIALDLMKFADKPVRELSGGNMRKLAIALAFFSPADIILLDEPTSSLDPVARHCVHELVNSYHGQKTFMLCTHLLSEAEALCDVISIMIKGCVYTFGTPQYLSQKFGTEYKIDIMLDDDSEESYAKCDSFFATQLPNAELTITRPKARIYAIPASQIELSDLFDIMGEGKKGDNGFCYYTCSSSSLERVFMEIVRLSEAPDHDEIVIHQPTLQSV